MQSCTVIIFIRFEELKFVLSSTKYGIRPEDVTVNSISSFTLNITRQLSFPSHNTFPVSVLHPAGSPSLHDTPSIILDQVNVAHFYAGLLLLLASTQPHSAFLQSCYKDEQIKTLFTTRINPLNTELNPICQ